MPWFPVLVILATCILLPSFDSYSDAFMTARLFFGNYYQSQFCKGKDYIVSSHPKFAIASFLPILASWIFVIRHWLINESTLSRKLKTLPLVILQLYPQWRAARILFALARDHKSREWQIRREEYESGLRHIGEYSIIQLYQFILIF